MKELTVEATVENIGTVTDFINEELERLDFPMKAQMQIDIAVDELFSNIARYAYGSGVGKATVRFEEKPDSDAIAITFIDEGKPFNPLETPEPDTTLSADERKIGGLGIFLVRKTMDGVSYKYEDGQNRLTILKNRG